jgi:hypothetical protein
VELFLFYQNDERMDFIAAISSLSFEGKGVSGGGDRAATSGAVRACGFAQFCSS